MTNTSSTPLPAITSPAEFRRVGTDAASWLASHSLEILIGCTIGAAIVLLLLGVRAIGMRICRRDTNRTHWKAIIGRALALTRLWFMVAVAAQLVAGYANAPPLVAETIHFLFVVASVLQTAIWARVLVLGAIEHRAGIDPDQTALGSAMGIIRLLVSAAIFAIAIVLILDNLGVNVTGLIAGLGIGGIAIGLAAQGIFRDLFAALSIIFDKPFRRGDTIKFGDSTGRVEAIGLKTTRVRSVEGDEIIIANDKLLTDKIRNQRSVIERRALLTLQLLYRNDPALLATLPDEMRRIVEAEPHCRFGHSWLTDLSPNAVILELLFHVDGDAERFNAARHAVIVTLLGRLRAMGIGFNYPAPPPDEPPEPATVPAPVPLGRDRVPLDAATRPAR